MLQNFFKTAVRTILRNQSYALINFVGLTSGVALALLIMAYVRSELSYDRFHEKADRLYRIRYDAPPPSPLSLASTPPPIAPAMKDFFPEVEEAARVYGRNVSITRANQEEVFEETGVFFADSAIMRMFTFSFVKGNPEKALVEKFTVLINEEMAKKYFGDANPIGESLLFGGKHSFKVTGVVKNFPENSHLRFNMLVPYENMFDMETDETAQVLRNNLAINFVISHSYTYVLLKPGADPAKVDAQFDAFLKKHARPELLVGQKFTLFPLTDIHLRSTLLAEPTPPNSMTNLYIFIGVGVLTILIACINYINLATAQSLTRIKEIGLRKILGSMKYQIIAQFLSESFLFCLIAFGLSFAVFYFALPFLNEVTNKQLLFSQVADWPLILMAVGLLVLITFLAGGYPSYFVARFDSIHAIKGGAANLGSQRLRKVLVVFQLSIACLLLSGSLVIVKQLNFLADRPLGFKKDQIVTIPLFSQNLNGIFSRRDSLFQMRLQSYRDAVERQAGVRSTTLSSNAPGLGAVYRGTIPEGFTQEDRIFAANFAVDFDFLDTYEVEMLAGRFFSREYGTDVNEAFIVNEAAVKEFKWETPDQALGKTINREGKIGKVVGVVKDFHFTALTAAVSALVMEVNPNQFNSLAVRFDNANVSATINQLEHEWNNLFPEKSFEFNFLDEQLNQQYSSFQNFGTIIKVFTAIAVLISCLGVYGLVLFVVQRKVKEIGVRKVLGASVASILRLIYKEFAWLILMGFVLAVPVSYYLTTEWLNNFVYHTPMEVGTYLISLALVVLITAATIGYQALRASLANPVQSLRSE
jgi:putative ABC transport system permease protein